MQNNYISIDRFGFNWIDENKILRSIKYETSQVDCTITTLNQNNFNNIENCKKLISNGVTSIVLLENGEIIISSVKKLLSCNYLAKIGNVIDVCIAYSNIGILNDTGTLYILNTLYKKIDKFYEVDSIQCTHRYNYIIFNKMKCTYVYMPCNYFKCQRMYVVCALYAKFLIGIDINNLTYRINFDENKIFERLVKSGNTFNKVIYDKYVNYLIDDELNIYLLKDEVSLVYINYNKIGKCYMKCNNILYLNEHNIIVCNHVYKYYADIINSSKFYELDYTDVNFAISLNFWNCECILLKLNSSNTYKLYMSTYTKNIKLPNDFTLYEETDSSYI